MRSPISLALVAALSFGCSKTFIPNTTVEATDENKKVVDFCESYRHAMEERNAPKLVAMVSPRYHSRAVGTRDYVDYDRAKQTLTEDITRTNAIRFEVKYREILFGENDHVFVHYQSTQSWKATKSDGSEQWFHSVHDNELELVPEGETYKIIAGM